MVANAKTEENYKRVESILVSQPKPTRSPYFELEEKFGIKIDFRQFIHVEPVPEKEFRRNRIRPDEFDCVVFTSLNSIEHFFRMCEDMRIKMSQETKYFCLTEAIANYLQKFILYRKRKVFFGKRVMQDMHNALMKHRKGNRFIVPCSNLGSIPVVNYLKDKKFDFQEAMMYQTVSSDLSDLSDITYDVLVFFSPLGIKSLYENFPDFKQNETRIAVFGKSTMKAVEDKGLKINIQAPTKEFPSMTMALKNYLNMSNK
ncbi:MAG: uroporphyrinogen-III synthase [Saprospirales bacterium]|nr:MAG: uroporphyrinogen-III synthase [Saprospirales bacterium]